MPDNRFRSLSEIGTPEVDTETHYTYNESGQLILITRTLLVSKGKNESVFSYNANKQLIQVKNKTIDPQENVLFRTKIKMTYTEGRLTQWEKTGSDPLRFVGSSATLKYGHSGLIESIVHSLFGTGGVTGSTTIFKYNESSLIISTLFANLSNQTTFIYDNKHRLIESKNFDLTSEYTYEDGLEKDWIIDFNSDGIVEAKLTTEWEEGLCKNIFLERPRQKNNFFLYNYYPRYLPESVFFKLPGC